MRSFRIAKRRLMHKYQKYVTYIKELKCLIRISMLNLKSKILTLVFGCSRMT